MKSSGFIRVGSERSRNKSSGHQWREQNIAWAIHRASRVGDS